MSRSKLEDFFAFARERHSIYLRRKQGLAPPWTEDPVLRTVYFTNVYRELDKTTAWFRVNVRERLVRDRSVQDMIPATLIYRWFNRIELGELIFAQPDIFDGLTIFEKYVLDQKWEEPGWLGDVIRARRPRGPYVSGAYIIKAENGVDKLTGVTNCIDRFMDMSGWGEMTNALRGSDGEYPMQMVWEWFRSQYYVGDFTGYEMVCDLRYTPLLERAPDRLTWASAGPGARRGLNRVFGRGTWDSLKPREALSLMQDVLFASGRLWPNNPDYPPWEMREVEHTLCEFDKYERVRLGQGRPRGVFP